MNCESCGKPLVRVLGQETITTLEGETMVFRRTSDYLLCRNCLRLYSVVELRDREEVEPVTEDIPDLAYFSVLESENEPQDARGNGRRSTDQLDSADDELES